MSFRSPDESQGLATPIPVLSKGLCLRLIYMHTSRRVSIFGRHMPADEHVLRKAQFTNWECVVVVGRRTTRRFDIISPFPPLLLQLGPRVDT